ncbi:MAG: ATP-binding protein [Aureispira sp.]|nr:ATP-binding protein [Aureispira sp.]
MAKITNSPFKFLDAYGKEDEEIFFGRKQETEELYDRMFETNLVLLYGASGTGKTSLINCGLANQFESTDWNPIFVRLRGHDMIATLKEELRGHCITKLDQNASVIKLVNTLYKDYFKPVYIILDQFEELFILTTKDQQKAFFEELYKLLEAHLQCKVLISMREEYIAYLSEYEDIIPTLFDNRLRVEKMNSTNLKEVIIKTTQEYDIQMIKPDEVATQIIEKLRDKNHQIDLANLQVYLDRLYRLDVERRGKTQRKIQFDDNLIKQTGGLEDVMSSFLDEQLDVLEQELVKTQNVKQKGVPLDILFALVTDNGTKQAVDVAQIKKQLKRAKNIESKTIDYCISRFKEMRILRELSQ